MVGRLFAVRRGVGVVEYAIGLNLLLLLTLGVADLGRAVWIHTSLAYLAREGARHGAIASRTATDVQNYVVARARLPDFTTANVTMTRCKDTTGAQPIAVTQVAVTAPFESITGIIGGIWRGGPLTLRASSRMFVEGTFGSNVDVVFPGLAAC